MFGLASKDEDNTAAEKTTVIHSTLRNANIARQCEWDGNGHANNTDWRLNELMGETGEVCNVLKKLHRERAGVPGSRSAPDALAEEIADVVICLDLCLMTIGVREAVPSVVPRFNDEPLTALGRRLFRSVHRFDCSVPAGNAKATAWSGDAVMSICTMIAEREGIDLNRAVEAKFNATSRKVGLATRLRY